ncbi:MAG: dcm [Clostridiaceae bacterium]|nr:dcm [Clostridiaceae bacterium]
MYIRCYTIAECFALFKEEKVVTNKMSRVYKVGSLFAGVGGVCLGFQSVFDKCRKYKLVWANEIDEYACETYRTNFKHKLIQGDINKVLNPDIIENLLSEINKTDNKKMKELQSEYNYYKKKHEEILSVKLDVLLGGFPCQAFSIAGERKGFADDRGNLFLSIINLINQLQEKYGTDGRYGINGKPRVLFLENVKNLKSHDNGRTYEVIKGQLEKLGYIIKANVLNTMDYSDLPQNRERIYILGFLHKEDADKFDLFDKIESLKRVKTEQERIVDIKKIIDYSINTESYEKYYYSKDKYPNYFITTEEYNKLSADKRKAERVNLDEQITEMYQFYQVRRGMYVRKNKSGVCPTLTANMGTGGHNVPLIKVSDGIRKLTPTEVFKLQGFPINNGYNLPTEYKGKVYSDSHLYKQAGNAVSVPVIEFLAKEILKILN